MRGMNYEEGSGSSFVAGRVSVPIWGLDWGKRGFNHRGHKEHKGEEKGDEPRKARKKSGSLRTIRPTGCGDFRRGRANAHHSGK